MIYSCGLCGYDGPYRKLSSGVAYPCCPRCNEPPGRYTFTGPSRPLTSTMSQSEQGHNDIWGWRFKQFQGMGFSLTVADDLAHTKMEVEAARRLVCAGCPLSLVQRILRGTSPFGEDYDDYLETSNVGISSTSEYEPQTATDSAV